MPKFSQISKARLATCHPDLQAVCHELIKQYDFSVLEGHRGEKAQNEAYQKGTSRVKYPYSAHNKTPARAVDIAPYPIDWADTRRFCEMIHRFDALAHILRERGEITSHFTYGGNWATLKDWPHIEIKEIKK